MELVKEQIQDYKDLLKECFSTDPSLLNKWHIIAGQDLDKCVERTYQDLQKCNVDIFKVTDSSKLVGYFGKEDIKNMRFLTGFFILPEFRTPEGRTAFMQVIETEFKKPYYCGLYEKNIPANRFIQSNGGTLIKQANLSDGIASLYRIGV